MIESHPDDEGLRDLISQVRARGDVTVDALVTSLWAEFHREAEKLVGRERAGHTLQATELVHKAYLRLRSNKGTEWQNRSHVVRTFARVMRHILVDEARRRNAGKRQGEMRRLTYVTLGDNSVRSFDDILSLHLALEDMTAGSGNLPRMAEALEMVFFAGATWDEVAEHQKLSQRQVLRDYQFARTWLERQMGEC